MKKAKPARGELEAKARLLVKGERALGPGKADLLDAIKQHGSISKAAKAMGMSYSRAWELVEAMNRLFKQPLVETESGGKRGGGARVTQFGEETLAVYRDLETALETQVVAFVGEFRRRLK